MLSTSAEKSLVAYLTAADQTEHQQLTADQIALGRELRQVRSSHTAAGKGKPTRHPVSSVAKGSNIATALSSFDTGVGGADQKL